MTFAPPSGRHLPYSDVIWTLMRHKLLATRLFNSLLKITAGVSPSLDITCPLCEEFTCDGGFSHPKAGFPQVISNEISWPFPDQFPILLTFCSVKHDILTFSGIHMGHTDGKHYCGDHLAYNNYDLSFLCAISTKLWLGLQNVQKL